MMNEASQWRLTLAQLIAQAYADNPKVALCHNFCAIETPS
jgi:hypothetical protein